MTLSRDELRVRLDELAKSPKPKNLSPGAMCYRVRGDTEKSVTVEYVCPICQTRTVHALKEATESFGLLLTIVRAIRSAPAKRTVVSEIMLRNFMEGELSGVSELELSLDESELCSACCPDLEEPMLVLVVTYSNGESHRFRGLECEDLQLIKLFLDGSRVYEGRMGAEYPLKKKVPRLKKLLGLED